MPICNISFYLKTSGTSSASPAPPAASSSSSGPSGTPTPPGGDRLAGSATGALNKNLNTEGLPEGWTMQVAPNGRVSFSEDFPKGPYFNYVSMFLSIFDQLSTLVSMFSK